MNTTDPEERISRLLRELADEQEKRLPPEEMGQVERNALLREVERTLARPRPQETLWVRWRSHLWPALAFGATAAVVLAAAIFFLANGPWKRPSDGGVGPVKLALQWPSPPPFNPSALKVWQSSQPYLAKGLPDFDRSMGTLGASPDDPYSRWRLATVIVRSEEGFGSGAFVSSNGWLLTDYHVVAEAAQKAAVEGRPATVKVITARIIEGRIKPLDPPLTATLYRADPRHDLALLKLETPPEGTNQIPYFPLGDQVRDGQPCFVVGSQHNGPAWWLRSGNISQEFDYPQDLSQFAAGVASDKAKTDRTRTSVIVSDARISPGDSGGPLLNTNGELIGLTFATAANVSAGSVGWHIALQDVRAFLARLPDRPEGVPFDPWTAGLPRSVVLEPELADGDGDGRIDSLRYRHASQAEDESPGGSARAVAATIFVNFRQRENPGNDALARVPAGLWGMEERGGFRFDVFVMARADGLTAAGYSDGQGVVNEIRLGRSGDEATRVLWSRAKDGRWRSTMPAPGTSLLDATRLGATNLRRLQAITGGILTTPTQRFNLDKQKPRSGEGRRGQTPNKM